MSIRLTILLLSIPLFLLLGGLNGALLVRQETAEMERALNDQAVAAAVTVAAFAAAAPDPARYFAEPARIASVRRAAAEIRELRALYLARHQAVMMHLIEAAGTIPFSRLRVPEMPVVLPVGVNDAGNRVIAALAPVSGDAFVVSEVDAEPLYARIDELKRMLVLILIAAGLIGGSLALLVARRVKSELARNEATIAAIARGDLPPDGAELRIQETRDLAGAVRLMGSSLAVDLERRELARAARDLLRDEADGAAAYHRAAFAPASGEAAGVTLEVRILGDAPPGCFFAFCKSPDGKRGALVMGECAATEPTTALALALAARHFFGAHMCGGPMDECIAMGTRAFNLTRVVWCDWADVDRWTTQTLCLLDDQNAERASAYVRQAATLGPENLMEDLAVLLAADGALAILVRPSRPLPDLGEGRVDVGLDLENARKPADVEDFVHRG